MNFLIRNLRSLPLAAVVAVSASCAGTVCADLPATLADQLADADGPALIELPAGRLTEPLVITRGVTLRGHADGTTVDVTADAPAIRVESQQPVAIENLSVAWQLATSRAPRDARAAILVTDTELTVRNCKVAAAGNNQRCPTALVVSGFSTAVVEDCTFRNYEFTIASSGGAETTLRRCDIRAAGHCGASVYSGSTLTVDRCVVSGADFHGLRCTGGTLNVSNSLIVDNKNRGIYLGNKSAHGTITNNLFARNASGISAFASSDATITNNVFVGNTFVGCDFRNTCPLEVRGNVFASNAAGVILFSDGAIGDELSAVVKLGVNGFWQNDIDAKEIVLPEATLTTDPKFANESAGDFSATAADAVAAKIGLTDAELLVPLWRRHQASTRDE